MDSEEPTCGSHFFFAAFWLAFGASLAVGQIVCPPADFLTIRSFDLAQNDTLRIIDRQSDGSYDVLPFLRRPPFTQRESVANFEQHAIGCLPLPPPEASNNAVETQPRGRASTELLFVPDGGNGAGFVVWTVFRGDELWVFESNQDRTLRRRAEYVIEGFRNGVVSGDYDGDRILDLAVLVAVQGDQGDDIGRIAILKGAGDGTFGPPDFIEAIPNFSQGPTSMVTAKRTWLCWAESRSPSC